MLTETQPPPGKTDDTAAARLRAIAFYLPQYHPLPENDEWWGEGFTEWTNVRRARPQFRGHYQPHVPTELGYYDLRSVETREAQADLAREYGVSGFCYYHYWFNGRRMLERPFNEVLASGKPDFPFCLCWANENWTRVWDGHDREVLIQQRYSEDDDREHIRMLLPALHDPRYIRVEGRPLFAVYRAGRLPDPSRTADIWRQEAERSGLSGLFLCRVESLWEERGDPRAIGFDAAIEFQPDFGAFVRQSWSAWAASRKAAIMRKLRIGRGHARLGYPDLVKTMLQQPLREYSFFPGVTPGWDNSPRRASGAGILEGASPRLYSTWLSKTVRDVIARERDPTRRIVFINAWNEWGEGNHLEPSQRDGRSYLEATRDALAEATR